jgi:sigma-54-specific transcriptional regulator
MMRSEQAHRMASGSPGAGGAAAVLTLECPLAHARAVRATALTFADPRSRALAERIARIAPSEATALIVGETGTGKELVAREVHRRSRRADRPFVAVNCAALPEQIVESELFGHERGAFTGADAQKRGWFETASGGTLFLDEVGELPIGMQVKLLRVLQEREVNRLGSRVPIPIDVRIVAATNVHLEQAVGEGRFREDLYYRLNVARLDLAPLRERPGDILPLARHFLATYATGSPVRLSPATETALLSHPWPGNIRELENVIQQALLVVAGTQVEPEDLNLAASVLLKRADDRGEDSRASDLEAAFAALDEHKAGDLHAEVEARLFRHALRKTGSNQVKAAQLLGISRNVLRHRMKGYGLL